VILGSIPSTPTASVTGAVGQTPIDPRLKPAAHEFEACLMKEFLEPLQHDALFSDSKDGDGGDDAGEGSGSALMSFGSEALAKAISERGGFGIAAKILDHFGQGKAGPAAKAGTG
jgi:peptidoglycan hydrolase FlgJ